MRFPPSTGRSPTRLVSEVPPSSKLTSCSSQLFLQLLDQFEELVPIDADLGGEHTAKGNGPTREQQCLRGHNHVHGVGVVPVGAQDGITELKVIVGFEQSAHREEMRSSEKRDHDRLRGAQNE